MERRKFPDGDSDRNGDDGHDRGAPAVRAAETAGLLSVRRVTAAFWAVLVTLAVLQSVSFYHLARRERADRRQEASQQALLDLRTLRSEVRAARARDRGYVITGDARELEAYHLAVTAAGEGVKRLAKSMEVPAESSATIARLTDAALAEMAEVMRAYDQQGVDGAARQIRDGSPQQAMERFEAAIDQASRGQEEATGLRSSEEVAAVHRGIATFGIVTGADLAMLVAGYWMLQRYAAHRRRVEEVLSEASRVAEAARAEAETANHAKDRILATVSHDLRTPLAGILLWTELAKGASNKEELQQALSAIEISTTAQARLVEDLLDASRTLGGALRLERARVNFADIVRRGCEAVQPTAAAKEVALTVDVPAEEEATVEGDALRLQQVVWNIVGNAVKFTPAQGRVGVSLQRCGGDGDGQAVIGAGWLRLEVVDTGPGIEAADLPHVFEAFFQVESPGHARAGGVGLGLAIVKQLVERHGGRVAVSSAGRGSGATFSVMLPVSVTPSAEPARVADTAAPASV
jgi:signal transduction histidine kinase